VKDIAVNGYHSLFLKNDGTVWAAGYNQYGQLGDSTNINRKHAKQIPGLTNVVDIAAGESHSLFVKSDGTVWACGINNFGQLGTGDFTDYNYPVQVPGLFNIVAVGTGYNQSFFLQNSGILYGCGFNSSGQLGIGSYNDAASPQQILGLQCIVSTSVHDIDNLNNSWNVYPVPTAENLQLSFDFSGTYRIQLTDVFSKVLRQDEVYVQAGEAVNWNVSELQSGTYFVSITNNNSQVSTKRIIKL
jgi:alpha-tubulin suppressor-like RCC1 family protein